MDFQDEFKDNRKNKNLFLSQLKATKRPYTCKINSRHVSKEEFISYIENYKPATFTFTEGDRVIAGTVYHFSNLYFGEDRLQIKSTDFFASSLGKEDSKVVELDRDEVVELIADHYGFSFKEMMKDVHKSLREKDITILKKYNIRYEDYTVNAIEEYKNNNQPYKATDLINRRIRQTLKEVMEDD